LIELVLTREDANSESALLVEWLAGDRTEVKKGQPVCVIETSKSAIEIESPGDGTLCRFAETGAEVELGGKIAIVAESADELAEIDRLRDTAPAAVKPSEHSKATRKAVELAAEHGVDLATISKSGFITVEDVEAVLAQREAEERGEDDDSTSLYGVSTASVSLPASFRIEPTAGTLAADFFARLRTDPETVRALPAQERLALYREHGAQIGAGVQLGEQSLIVAPRIVLDDGVDVGDSSTIRCDEVVSIGALTKFGPRFQLQCRRAFIGSGGYFADDVLIGGGGVGDPQALFVIGDLAFVGAEAFINPCRPVIIGREVFVTMRSVLVTHNVGHSLLEGFENRFAPIVLEDRAQIGIGAVVYAGVRVGKESIVGSNSYVVSDIPPGKLAIGVPARVAGEATRTLSSERRADLAERMFGELRELVALRGHDVVEVDEQGLRGFAISYAGQTAHVLFTERIDSSFQPPKIDGETVVLTLALEGAAPADCSVLDLIARRVHGSGGVALDSVREFCRKRGIRFEPGPWRYSGGFI
jgi:acetyltransferase-like isoleucine patch superfamily enzyme/glycine cleavage system H lipoate-binding protein